MKKIMYLFIAVGMFMTAQVCAKSLDFGTPVDKNLLTPISTILQNPDGYLNKMVTVEGTIVGVCEKRGCWLDFASDKQYEKLRIKVKDGVMVFPLSAQGRKALATGTLKKISLSLEKTIAYLAHQAEHHDKPFDPASVTEPIVFYQLSPEGVSILD